MWMAFARCWLAPSVKKHTRLESRADASQATNTDMLDSQRVARNISVDQFESALNELQREFLTQRLVQPKKEASWTLLGGLWPSPTRGFSARSLMVGNRGRAGQSAGKMLASVPLKRYVAGGCGGEQFQSADNESQKTQSQRKESIPELELSFDTG